MARIKAYASMDMIGGRRYIADIVYADEDVLQLSDGRRDSFYFGDFRYPNGEWKGTIEKIQGYYDGELVSHISGLHLSTRYATVGTTAESPYRSALDGGDTFIGSDLRDRLVC